MDLMIVHFNNFQILERWDRPLFIRDTTIRFRLFLHNGQEK